MNYINLISTRVLVMFIFLFVGLSHSTNIAISDQRLLPKITLEQVKKIDPKQLACMANNIFYEANGESYKGQAAVARVVMNRINHGFGANPCKVINQVTKVDDKKVCQFSWVCDMKPPPNKNSLAYKRALNIAYEVLVYDMHKEVLPKNALFFHNIHVDPLWQYKQVAVIGNHIFYSKVKKDANKQKQ